MNAFLSELFSLDGRVAVVTGGSSGIGRAIALGLGQAGASVVVVARQEPALRETVDELPKGAYVVADLSSRTALAAACEAIVEPFGPPEVLVHAAGLNLRPPFAEQLVEQWDQTMAINLDAAYLLGQAFGPGMAERGWGRIINIGSQQSVRAFGNSGAYGVSKAATLGLTRSQAEAWSSSGVCCNAIVPGFVKTPLTQETFANPERVAQLAARTMMGRNGLAEDFVGAAIFLASDASAYVTGQAIFVDGGFSVY